jgi:hypothetical protein
MTTSYKAQTNAALGSFQYLMIEKILWETPLTVGDQIIFQDNFNNVLTALTCDTANISQCLDWSPKPKRWADFLLTKISSGTVYLFVR